MPWVLCAVLLAASIQDLRRREVSDLFPIGLIVCAVIALVMRTGANANDFLLPPGWYAALVGLVLGSCVGFLLYRLARFGGGDATLIAAIGACVGPAGLLIVLAWMALAGMILSIVALVRQKTEIAYVPAIAVGTIVYVADAGLLPRLMGF